MNREFSYGEFEGYAILQIVDESGQNLGFRVEGFGNKLFQSPEAAKDEIKRLQAQVQKSKGFEYGD
jgi:hypothetical protein